MRRLVPTAVLLLAGTGCTEQEAVPLTRSVPMGFLLALVPVAALWCAWRTARSEPTPLRPVAPWRRVAGVALAVPAAVLLAWITVVIADVAFGWREVRYAVLSWEHTAVVAWIVVPLACVLMTFQVAAAAALLRRQPWASVVAAGEVLLLGAAVC